MSDITNDYVTRSKKTTIGRFSNQKLNRKHLYKQKPRKKLEIKVEDMTAKDSSIE